MECLYSVSWGQFFPLGLGSFTQIAPSLVKLVLTSDNFLAVEEKKIIVIAGFFLSIDKNWLKIDENQSKIDKNQSKIDENQSNINKNQSIIDENNRKLIKIERKLGI